MTEYACSLDIKTITEDQLSFNHVLINNKNVLLVPQKMRGHHQSYF